MHTFICEYMPSTKSLVFVPVHPLGFIWGYSKKLCHLWGSVAFCWAYLKVYCTLFEHALTLLELIGIVLT